MSKANVVQLDQYRPAKLRCRVGDIVMVITQDINRGKLGTVARALLPDEIARFPQSTLHWRVEALGSKFSVTDPSGTEFWTADHFVANDGELMPLRNQPGQDEMLRITGKPKKTRAPKRQKEGAN